MANRIANKSIVLIGKESAYGTAQTTPATKLVCACNVTPQVTPIEIARKNQTLEPQSYDKVAGVSAPTVELSGVLTPDAEILLQAFLMDSASPYVFQTEQSNYSYTIMQAYPAATDDAGDGMRALGCRLESLSITGAQGGSVEFTATFRAKSVDWEVDFSTVDDATVTDFTAPETDPFLFQSVTCALISGAMEKLLAFNIDFTSTFADDSVSFQNSAVRVADTVCQQSCVIGATWIYDTLIDAGVYDNLVGTLDIDTISLKCDGCTWTFTTYGKYLTYAQPDANKCLVQASMTKELMGDSAETALSIAVS